MGKKPSITVASGRHFLKDLIRQEVDFRRTLQSRGEPTPAAQKPLPQGATPIPLPCPDPWPFAPCDLLTAIANRKSHRRFLGNPLSMEELSLLLWATQGVRQIISEAAVLRTVPSAGCRHPFETYLAVQRVTSLQRAIYRYLPLDHALVLERQLPFPENALSAATHGQRFVGEAAVTFIWTAIPARTEWRYAEASYKVMALDAGHVCQNLYLACEAIGAGTCAIAAYDQQLMDQLLEVDGDEEFTVYLAPVGKVARRRND
jgi:SagB-type dehydrogenase family enzyme